MTFNTTIKVKYKNKKLENKIDQILEKYFNGQILPSLENIVKKILFIKKDMPEEVSLLQFKKDYAGLFSKFLVNDMNLIDEKSSIVKFKKSGNTESIDIELYVDEITKRDLELYPMDYILKKLTNLDNTKENNKFDISIKKGDFEK